jgi:hypothetical protein
MFGSYFNQVATARGTQKQKNRFRGNKKRGIVSPLHVIKWPDAPLGAEFEQNGRARVRNDFDSSVFNSQRAPYTALMEVRHIISTI